MTVTATFEPRLPKPVVEATRRLLSAALRCRIAADLADARVAREAATEVLRLLDDVQPKNSAHQRAVNHHQPELWADINGS